MSARPPVSEYRTWIFDSRRWAAYRPRPDDVIIATYPKSGTTWMQQIVSSLVFRDGSPRPLMDLSIWVEKRFPEPVGAMAARMEAQSHRRFLKSHLPADGLPLFDKVRYIHVARDGRDAALSLYNHARNFTPAMLDGLDRAGLEDERVGVPYPRMPEDPADHFHRWLTQAIQPGHDDGLPYMSYFSAELSWWHERGRPNVLLVHFADLKADLAGEMRRIADFLEVDIQAERWPELVEAADFLAMRGRAEVLLGSVARIFESAPAFFHSGANSRWKGVFREEDLALYEAKLSRLPPRLASWLSNGSRSAAHAPAEADPCKAAPS